MRDIATGITPGAAGAVAERRRRNWRPDILVGVSIDAGDIAAAVDDLARVERYRIELLQDYAAADAAAGRQAVIQPDDIACRRVRLALVDIASQMIACLPREPAMAE